MFRALVHTDAERVSSPPLLDLTSQTDNRDDERDASVVVGLPQVDGLAVAVRTSSDTESAEIKLDVSTETGRARDESLVALSVASERTGGDDVGELKVQVELLEGVLDTGRSDRIDGDDCGLVNLGTRCALLELGDRNDGLLGLGGKNGLLGLGGDGR